SQFVSLRIEHRLRLELLSELSGRDLQRLLRCVRIVVLRQVLLQGGNGLGYLLLVRPHFRLGFAGFEDGDGLLNGFVGGRFVLGYCGAGHGQNKCEGGQKDDSHRKSPGLRKNGRQTVPVTVCSRHSAMRLPRPKRATLGKEFFWPLPTATVAKRKWGQADWRNWPESSVKSAKY